MNDRTMTEHLFVKVPHQTGCKICGYSKGHHPTKANLADVITTCEGSIWIFQTQTKKAHTWVRKNVALEAVPTVDVTPESIQFTCEHRYGADIAYGMLDAGLTLEDSVTCNRVKGKGR